MNATSHRVLAAGEFYGTTDQSWKTPLVTLTLLRHATPRAVPMHAHANMYVALLLEGGYREWIGDDELVYAPLSAVFHPTGHTHRDEITAADSLFFTIEIDPAMVSSREQRLLRSVADLTGGPAIWSMLRLLETLRGQRRDTIEGEEPVVEILDQLLGPPASAPAPRWLARVESRLREGYAEPIALRDLAELAGVHPVHLARTFRRHHGTTIRSHLHAQRVLHASRAIAAGTPLADAALAAGFCDQAHLTHVFKAVTGMTPRRYAKLSADSSGARSARAGRRPRGARSSTQA
jgi:AraC family transcriptional regulator